MHEWNTSHIFMIYLHVFLFQERRSKVQGTPVAAYRLEGANQHSEVDRHNGGQPQQFTKSKMLELKYIVTQRTIARDSRLADALIALSEVSPETRWLPPSTYTTTSNPTLSN